MKLSSVLSALIASLLAGASPLAGAQGTWPSKPIRIVVPSAAGGASDFLARSFGRYVTQETGQPVIIENRPGAASIIGAQVVKESAPDGYTFLSSGMSTQAANPVLYTNLPYTPEKDFDEIGMYGVFPMIGLVRKDSPLRSVADIISYAKENPDKLTFGHHAASSLVPVELIKARAGVAIRAVPYKNVTDISMNVASGVIDLAFIDALSAAPALNSGLLTPIAVTTSKRFHSLPEVPTVAETLPGYSMDGWLGLSAPAGTPKPVLDRMNALLRDALADPTIKSNLESRGLVPTPMTLDEQKAWVIADRKRWVEWARIAKIQPEAR